MVYQADLMQMVHIIHLNHREASRTQNNIEKAAFQNWFYWKPNLIISDISMNIQRFKPWELFDIFNFIRTLKTSKLK